MCSVIELMVYQRVFRDCPISSCGAKYLVILANHFADDHQSDYIQRRQDLQEAKLQPKVKVVVKERKADNLRKNIVQPLAVAPVMRYEMTRIHVLMFISFLNLFSINTVRTKIKVTVFYK